MTNMTEQIISKETAILAKEKGFDWYVESIYTNYTDQQHELIQVSNIDWKIDFYKKNLLRAPTQSLLTKWLRDVHKFHISILSALYPFYYWQVTDMSKPWGVSPKITQLPIKILDQSAEFATYEEALEDALLKTLTLINTND